MRTRFQKNNLVAEMRWLVPAALLLAFCCAAGAQKAVQVGGARDRYSKSSTLTSGASPNMIYGQGKIMPKASIYSIFWGASWLNYSVNEFSGVPGFDKIAGIDSFYLGFSNSAYAQTSDEYTGSNGAVGPTTSYWGHLVDISPAADGSDSNAILKEVCTLITKPDPAGNGYYAVYGDKPRPKGAPWCAYHAIGSCGVTPVQFAYFANIDGDAGCDPQDTSGLHSQGLAALANVSAHELSEARTDPAPFGGWADSANPRQENGDKCAWTFNVPLVMLSDGAEWKIQGEWSNNAYNSGKGYANSSGQKGCLSGSAPSGWSTYTQLEQKQIVGRPAVVSWGLDRIDLFVHGPDNALWTKSWWNGAAWSGYTQLGPEPFLGDPSVVSMGPYLIDVFVQGTDNALWTKSLRSGTWTGYTQLGPEPIAGPPTAVSWGPNRIDVFVQGTDNALWWKFWNGSSWSGYTQLGPKSFLGQPAVVARGPNLLDVFVQATDGTLWTNRTLDGLHWSGYTQLGPSPIAGPPTAVSWGPNRIDVFVKGTDNALWTKSWNGASWSGYTQLGTEPIASVPSVVSWGSNRIDVFVQGTDNALWTKSWNGASWSGYTQLGTEPIVSEPSVVSWGPRRIDVFVRGTDSAVWTKYEPHW
jgi:hypothetical protein